MRRARQRTADPPRTTLLNRVARRQSQPATCELALGLRRRTRSRVAFDSRSSPRAFQRPFPSALARYTCSVYCRTIRSVLKNGSSDRIEARIRASQRTGIPRDRAGRRAARPLPRARGRGPRRRRRPAPSGCRWTHVCEGPLWRVDAGEEQVKRGIAWVYDRYVKDPSLDPIQDEARTAKRGLWADPYSTPPWEWREMWD